MCFLFYSKDIISYRFECQKVDFNLVAGKLHKAETVFVTLGEN